MTPWKMSRRRFCGAAAALVAAALAAQGQQPPAQPNPSSQDSSSSSKPNTDSGASAGAAPAAQQYNPLPAEKDVEVATYYMRKGDPDASIPRLEEAIKLNPSYAKPRLMLGEIYEKKRDNENAVKYYREYLQVWPHAPDAKKIQQKIDKLSSH